MEITPENFHQVPDVHFDKASDLIGQKLPFLLIRHDSSSLWKSPNLQHHKQQIGAIIQQTRDILTFDVTPDVKSEVFEVEILAACFMEAANGGRSNLNQYDTVPEYFGDPKVKATIQKRITADLMDRIGVGGDPERLSMLLKFKVADQLFEVDSSLWAYAPPWEWYSDTFKDWKGFMFPDGFYVDAEAAIASYALKKTDDLFGERYFPVVVFSKDKLDYEQFMDVCTSCKSTSQVIQKDGNWIKGTRCKPSEYVDVITECYEKGGQVPIGIEWSWGS